MVALGRVLALLLLAPCAWAFQPARPVGLARAPRLSPPRAVSEVSSESQFDEAIEGADEALVIVDYSTTWCGPCKVMEPKFVELSDQYDSAIFLKVIGDSCPEASSLMKREGVRSVPAFHFWKGGKKIDVVNGANTEALTQSLKKHA